jgi:hypothetical protein
VIVTQIFNRKEKNNHLFMIAKKKNKVTKVVIDAAKRSNTELDSNIG